MKSKRSGNGEQRSRRGNLPLPAALAADRSMAAPTGAAGYGSLRACVRDHGGVPTLFLNDQPQTGLMHWNRVPSPDDIAVFRDAGIHLFAFMGVPPMREAPGVPADYSDGLYPVPELTDEYLGKMFAMLEQADPQIRVLVRFRITPPAWWRARNPGKMIRAFSLTSGRYSERPHASVTSPEWMELVRAAIADRITFIEKRWGHLVFGYHPGLACCCENAYEWGRNITDYSETHLAAFRAWLAERYGTAGALNDAWRSTYASVAEAEFPDPALFHSRLPGDTRNLLDPATEIRGADFMRFNSEAMAKAVVLQARFVKETLRGLGREKVCGAFYGYAILPANLADGLCAGHRAHESVLACPDIDFICAPLNYSARQSGGCSAPQMLPASVGLHGKLYYAEEDTRYHCATDDVDRISDTPARSEPVLYRAFLEAWRSGGAIWWMDLFGKGWFRDRAFVPMLRRCADFARCQLANRASTAEIAFFVGTESTVWERAAPTLLSGLSAEHEVNELCACGAPFDIYRIEDIPLLVAKGRLASYRMAVVGGAYEIAPDLRAAIDRHLKADGRTVVWLSLAGAVSNRGLSAGTMSDLTGIRVSFVNNSCSLRTETFIAGTRIVYGENRETSPKAVANDPDAETLGWYVQGAGGSVRPGVGDGGALVSKRFADWRSVWSSSPDLPSAVLAKLAEESGVHIWSHGDQVIAAYGWVAIASKRFGPRRISFPPGSGLPGDGMDVDLARGELRLIH